MKMADNGRLDLSSRIYHQNEHPANMGSIKNPGTENFTNGTETGSGPGPKQYMVCIRHASTWKD